MGLPKGQSWVNGKGNAAYAYKVIVLSIIKEENHTTLAKMMSVREIILQIF